MTDKPLAGRVAVITGGSRGIGAAAAVRLAVLGADIAVIYSNNDAAASEVCVSVSAAGARAKAYRCDVADFNETKRTVDAVKADFGTVSVLVNNAGVIRDGLVMAMREAAFDEVISVNLKGAFNMIRHCAPVFVRAGWGRIVNVSSVAGLTGNAGQANYCASKAGLIGLTKATARELAPKGITCNAVAPGVIETDMTRGLLSDNGGAGGLLGQIPLGRAGSAEEAADAIAFLAISDYITGEVLRVDGGLAM